MKLKLTTLLFAALTNTYIFTNTDFFEAASSDIYIYGKVYTDDNEVYTGQIRWGKEEAFWFDHFNSSKPDNDNIEYLSRSEEKKLNRSSHRGSGWINGIVSWNNGNHYNDHTHIFACQFGDIKIKLEGGSNDIETQIQVTDHEIGHIKLDWDRIEKVEFMAAPANIKSHYGEPLYGTVTTENGDSHTGYVQWDHDERMSEDELNGENRDGEIDMEFGNISKIKKSFRGSEITTRSGREFELRGTNDVNDDNRGIIVNIPGMGRVDISWDEFDEVIFSDISSSSITYDDFKGDADIFGTVTTVDGDLHVGRIAYDLDEEYQFEMLNGKSDDIEYFIPFANVKSVKPGRRDRANVTLTDGSTITLEDSVDVSDDNDGVLIFLKAGEDPTYVAWEDIEKIDFN